MKKSFYLFSLLLILASCDKDDNYTILPDDLQGVWVLSGYDSYSVSTKNSSYKQIIIKNIETYTCPTDRFEFSIDNSSARPLIMDRQSCRRGVLGCDFTIQGDKLLDAVNKVEAFNLRILQDTLFLSIDETSSFNRDLETREIENVVIRNKYIKVNNLSNP